ncbi:hypothetical protein QF027_008495 [Streptomyces canus]|nr:hypothetical protein [Streptomyces canus]
MTNVLEVLDQDTLARGLAVPGVIGPEDGRAVRHEDPGELLVPADVFAVAVYEECHVPGPVVGPLAHGEAALRSGEDVLGHVSSSCATVRN